MNKARQNPMKTKKVMVFILLLCAIVVFSGTPPVQGVSASRFSRGSAAFDESTRILNIGVGFGSRAYYGFNRGFGSVYRSTPAFSISYEQALAKKAGPGFITMGGYFGFQNASYRYDDSFIYNNGEKYYYKHSWNYFFLAGRAAYHADALIWESAEIYFGLMAGLRFQTYSYSSNYPDYYGSSYALNQNSIYPSFSLFAGGRWYLTPKVALFGELGYGISYLTIGATFKL